MEHQSPSGVTARAVALVPGDGVADGSELHAYLVPSPRFETDLHERKARALADAGPCGQGAQGSSFTRSGDPHPRGPSLDEPGIEDSLLGSHDSLDEGDIASIPRPFGPAVHQSFLCPRVAGHHHDARGVSIEAMDDGRPRPRVAALEALGDEVEDGATPPSFGGDYGKAHRFIEDDDFGVLVKDGGNAWSSVASALLHPPRLTM